MVPHPLALAFMLSVRVSFYIGATVCLAAAVLSALCGSKYVYEIDETSDGD